MRIIRKARAMQAAALSWRRRGRRVGFVPTMGALHQGHLDLVRRASRENTAVVVSVFVNPAQFGPREDLSRYPRPFAKDRALCQKAGADILFAPSPADMYAGDHDTWVAVEKLSAPLCGPFRPGHFRGVATVVAQLFNIVQPDRAYFGRKDYQQLKIIQKMAADLHFPVAVVPCDTVREPSGLALSSRNANLSAAEKSAAPRLFQALRVAASLLKQRRGVSRARRAALGCLKKIPGARVQYLEVSDPDRLTPLKSFSGRALIAAAVFVGKTRLIDNIVVGRS